MKKIAAILLLALFLINLVGYRGWFYIAENQWEVQLQTALDKAQYNENDLITIKAPLLLPYVTDTKEFQRTDGEINLNGKIFRFVKSKVQNGEYILLCLPDQYKQKLETAKEDFFKNANDLFHGNSSKKSGKAYNNIISEYDQINTNFTLNDFKGKIGFYNIQRVKSLVTSPHFLPEQPPELS